MNYIHEVKQMKTNFGAGIIVQRNDGMVLGFCRQKDAKSMPTFGVVGGKVDPGEGRPMWIKPSVLLNSPFKEYNRKMMDFFGINYVNC